MAHCFSTVVVSIAVLAFVPLTADFALLINEFNHLKKILPDNVLSANYPKVSCVHSENSR